MLFCFALFVKQLTFVFPCVVYTDVQHSAVIVSRTDSVWNIGRSGTCGSWVNSAVYWLLQSATAICS